MTMRTFNAYREAHDSQKKVRDSEMWVMGMYVLSAVTTSIDNCFNGKKATSQYAKYPFSQQKEREEEDLKLQREAFLAGLMAMKSNFELSNNGNNKEGKE